MSKVAFVTGAAGFLGLHLVEELLDQGWQVIALRRPGADARALSAWPQVEQVEGDITRGRSLAGLIPRHVDCVFHVAGNRSLWSRHHAEQLKVNVRGTRNMVRAALEARARRFVYTSSICAYGLHGGLITEDTPTRGSATPVNYVRSRALAERQVHLGVAAGLSAVILNPANLLGRYDVGHWARMIQLIQQRRLPFVPSGGGSFCDARAVARAHVAAAERGGVAQNYLLGGAQTTYLGLAEEISRVLGVNARFVALPPRWMQAYAWLEERMAPLFGRAPEITAEAVILLSCNLYCSSRKAERELGYHPRPLEAMLRDTCDWLLSEGLLKPPPAPYAEVLPRPPR